MRAAIYYQFVGTEHAESRPERLKEIIQLLRAFARPPDDTTELVSVSRIIDGHPFTRTHFITALRYIHTMLERVAERVKLHDHNRIYVSTAETAIRMTELWSEHIQAEMDRADTEGIVSRPTLVKDT